MRFADLDAVTVDGYGTLLQLNDPAERLRAALSAFGVDRDETEVANAFVAEARHYRPRALLGRDAPSLAALRLECVGVFLDELGESIPPAEFVDAFIGALVFDPIEGAAETLERLRERGLRLAVVANWDCALEEHLDRADLTRHFDVVVSSARAGIAKPDPRIFELALAELGASPARALHVGDETVDEEGAGAAGLRFAPAPLLTAFEGWT